MNTISITKNLGLKSIIAGACALVAAGTMAGFSAAETKVDVGVEAPNFTLKDTEGKEHTLKAMLEKEGTEAVVIEWYNPECPFVAIHYTDSNQTMNKSAKMFKEKGVKWVRINSGADGMQGAGLEKNKQFKTKFKIDGPVLLDTKGDVGKKYGAKVTPEIFIVNKDGIIAYHGAVEDAKSMRRVGTTNHVNNALTEILAGESVSTPKTEARGCSVKYAK